MRTALQTLYLVHISEQVLVADTHQMGEIHFQPIKTTHLNNIDMKKIFFFLLLIFSGCSYHKDKLVIKNNSKEDISYEIFIKTKNEIGEDCIYKIVSAPGGFNFLHESSPIVRNYLSDEMDEFSCDSILYFYIYNKVDKENFYKNMDSIIYSKNAKFYKYSKKELDSMNWIISYPSSYAH
jgi:hypothetical protein